MTPYTLPEKAIKHEDAAAPARQIRSTMDRPIFDERPTAMGANVI
jgi:hypothetical protein